MNNPPPLIVGLDDALPPPMQFGDPANDTFRGYEVDLLRELARALERPLSYRRAPWSRLIHELNAGTIDLVCGAATITPERAEQVLFSRSYLPVSLAVVSRTAMTAAKLHAAAIGVRAATTAAAYLLNQGFTVARVSESNDELYDELATRQLDAIVDDSSIANAFARGIPGVHVSLIDGTQSGYALMMRKGNEALRSRVDNVIERLERDGTMHRLQEQWGLTTAC
jgi:polar amino acid transport system substrate-binding protein